MSSNIYLFIAMNRDCAKAKIVQIALNVFQNTVSLIKLHPVTTAIITISHILVLPVTRTLSPSLFPHISSPSPPMFIITVPFQPHDLCAPYPLFSPIIYSHLLLHGETQKVSYSSIHELAIARVPVFPLALIQGRSTDLFTCGRMRVTGFVYREESFTGLRVTKIPVLRQQAERVAPPVSSVLLAPCKAPEM